MRGTQMFNDIFTGPDGRLPKRKGRNNNLLSKRNDCLIHRYYYYGHFTDKRFDLVLEQLREEFFLSIDTLSVIIKDNTEKLRELKNKKPEANYFQCRWPHLRW